MASTRKDMTPVNPHVVDTPDGQRGCIVGVIGTQSVVEFKGRRQAIYPLAGLMWHLCPAKRDATVAP
jgi:hypothetical protein